MIEIEMAFIKSLKFVRVIKKINYFDKIFIKIFIKIFGLLKIKISISQKNLNFVKILFSFNLKLYTDQLIIFTYSHSKTFVIVPALLQTNNK